MSARDAPVSCEWKHSTLTPLQRRAPWQTDWVDFKTIRAQVGIVDILRHYGLLNEADAAKEQFKIHCPFHDDTKPSCNVNTTMQAFRCFGCGVSGGIFMVVRLMEDIDTGNDLADDREAARLISEWFRIEMKRTRPALQQRKKPREAASKPDETPADIEASRDTDADAREENRAGERTTTDEPPKDEPINPPIGDESSWFPQRDPTHEYLTIERGLTPETIAHFGLGYHAGRGMMAGRIVIPIHNEAGQLIAFAGRWPGVPAEGEGEPLPKYKLPPKFKASHVVYNLYRVPPDARATILVEGFFDVIELHQAASVPTIALMGTQLSERQAELITSTFNPDTRIVLAFDPDPAGHKCADTCLTTLGRSFWVKSVPYPDLLAEFKNRRA